ncbi:alpha/beta fold hydrolase [Streptosporangium roseum]|uniref:alpha/beta fold hydrolase n=1 Tax=Streptosporangium roseum TaxID=2001 RepID=UPI00068A0906
MEFLDVIGPLTDPRSHGDDPAQAFHLVIPSIPGFGLSGPTSQRGWDVHRVARAWAELLRRLGYDRYGAQGGDRGSAVSRALGTAAQMSDAELDAILGAVNDEIQDIAEEAVDVTAGRRQVVHEAERLFLAPPPVRKPWPSSCTELTRRAELSVDTSGARNPFLVFPACKENATVNDVPAELDGLQVRLAVWIEPALNEPAPDPQWRGVAYRGRKTIRSGY